MRTLLVMLGLVTTLAVERVPSAASAPEAARDPRQAGLEIGLGEWAVTPEAKAVRPGPVTLVVPNRGRYVHGLRIEAEDVRRHRGDRFRARTWKVAPGTTARLDVDLPEGVYTIECFVEDHDDRGMRTVLEVRADAPLVAARQAERTVVRIAAFAFAPARLRVKPGVKVTWRNDDPAPHTVTGVRSFRGSGELRKGSLFSTRFARRGTYRYLCAIHPQMRGTVVVG